MDVGELKKIGREGGEGRVFIPRSWGLKLGTEAGDWSWGPSVLGKVGFPK